MVYFSSLKESRGILEDWSWVCLVTCVALVMGHARFCHGCKKGCGMCKFRRLKQTWKLRLGKTQQGDEHWLAARFTKKGWGVGCRVCAAKGLHTPFARFALTSRQEIQLINFKRHQNSRAHQESLGNEVPTAADRLRPAVDLFLELLHARQERRAMAEISRSLKVNRQRVRKMQFCLAEGHRHYVRLFFKQARCVAFHTDAREGRLVTRFAATTRRLKQLRGTLPFPQRRVWQRAWSNLCLISAPRTLGLRPVVTRQIYPYGLGFRLVND